MLLIITLQPEHFFLIFTMQPGSGVIKSPSTSGPKLGLMMVAASLLVIALVIALTLHDQYEKQSIAIEANGRSLIRILSNIPRDEMLSNARPNSVVQILTDQINRNDLDYWEVLDHSGGVLASGSAPETIIPPASARFESLLSATQTQKADTAKGIAYQEFQAPLLSNGQPTGTIRIGYTEPRLRIDVKQIPFLAQISLPIFLLTSFCYVLVKRALTPIEALGDRLNKLIHTPQSGPNTPNAKAAIHRFAEGFTLLEKRLSRFQEENSDTIASNHILSYQRRKLELILQTIPYAVVILDEEGKATFTNAKTETLLGITSDQIIGKIPQHWCKNSSLAGLLLKYQSNITPLFQPTSMELSPLDNPDHTLEVSVHPLLQPDNLSDSLGTLAIFRDITKEVTARQGRDEFISHVAHELKSPLNIIHMFVDMLLSNESLEREQKIESLNSINDQTERLTTLVSNLLSITKIESGTLSLVTQRVNTWEFLKDTFSAAAANGKNTGLSFDLKLPKTLSSINVDKELFRVALNNLLSNAVKYNRPGGTISLEAEETENNLSIRVFDNGIGINLIDQARIFDKFYRSEAQEVLEKNGQGLGLALVKQIVEIHHGTITLNSEKGKGSEFIINLKKTSNLLKQAG